MPSTLDTSELHRTIERLRAGDRAAQEQLVGAVAERVERIARVMLRRYPRAQQWADTDDVFQQALMRLLTALRKIRPENTRDFFRLAAYLVRQELIDFTRRVNVRNPGGRAAPLPAVVDPQPSPAHLDAWRRFHQAIEELPAEEREVVSLAFYHGWTQAQIASVAEVDVRTVRRRWASACVRLRDALGDDLDELFAA